MGYRFFQTLVVARNLPGALLVPYVSGVFDGVVGATGLFILKNHPVIGGIMLAYAVVASTLNVALATRRH
jgi:hypothetical protein